MKQATTQPEITINDARGRERHLTILFAFKNARGTLSARILSDNGKTYFTRFHNDGRFECDCPSHRCCYHFDALIQLYMSYGAEGHVKDMQAADRIARAEQVAMANDKTYKQAITAKPLNNNVDYNLLATSKKPVSIEAGLAARGFLRR